MIIERNQNPELSKYTVLISLEVLPNRFQMQRDFQIKLYFNPLDISPLLFGFQSNSWKLTQVDLDQPPNDSIMVLAQNLETFGTCSKL